MDSKVPLTYRASKSVADRIKILKSRYGVSFQYMTDTFYQEWLYKLQYETDIFKDLLVEKQVRHITKDIAELPVFRSFFKRQNNHPQHLTN